MKNALTAGKYGICLAKFLLIKKHKIYSLLKETRSLILQIPIIWVSRT